MEYIKAIITIFLITLFSSKISTAYSSNKIVISGAGTTVGFEVVKKLLLRKQFYNTFCLVDNNYELNNLVNSGVDSNHIKICDYNDPKSFASFFRNSKKVIICSSSLPKRKIYPQIKRKLFSLLGTKIPENFEELYYDKGKQPYDIDFIGQKILIDESLKNNAEQIVLLSLLGGYRGTKLNYIGRKYANDDIYLGNILKWKHETERYLIDCGKFTIVHAWVSSKHPNASDSLREIIWDIDDNLLGSPFKTTCAKDCAEVLVQALNFPQAIGKSIDIANRPLESTANKPHRRDGLIKMNWEKFWSLPGTCNYPSSLMY